MKMLIHIGLAALGLLFPSGEESLPGERAITYWTEGPSTISCTQVWDIVAETDDGDRVFCASNDGLCVFNGYGWDYPSIAGNPIIRALDYDPGSGRLYSSGVNGFGYWLPDGYGSYQYTPLYINEEFRSFSLDFWRIALSGYKVLFQSQQQIFVYDKRTDDMEIIPATESFRFIYEVGGRIWG